MYQKAHYITSYYVESYTGYHQILFYQIRQQNLTNIGHVGQKKGQQKYQPFLMRRLLSEMRYFSTHLDMLSRTHWCA